MSAKLLAEGSPAQGCAEPSTTPLLDDILAQPNPVGRKRRAPRKPKAKVAATAAPVDVPAPPRKFNTEEYRLVFRDEMFAFFDYTVRFPARESQVPVRALCLFCGRPDCRTPNIP